MPVTWRPITAEELDTLVERQLRHCSPAQKKAFERCRVPTRAVPFLRFGALEQVFVVAAMAQGLLYYEDVEEGFEIGTPDADGILRDHGCQQLELSHLLSRMGL